MPQERRIEIGAGNDDDLGRMVHELALMADTASARVAAQAAMGFGPEGERLALVLAEVVTNIVRHGWRGGNGDRIQLAIEHDTRRSALIARLRYPGLPFDWQLPSRTAAGMIDPLRPEGGLGLLVIHSIADDLASASDGPIQELTIVRQLRAPAAHASRAGLASPARRAA
jgi:anti-sigma regulatory factor (Ser/Thr protein kinase)